MISNENSTTTQNTYNRCLGVTGPTGAGKSFVCQILKDQGATIIDADMIARQVLTSEKKCIDMLVENFSNDVLDSNLKINRKKLACIAFSSKEKTHMLNKITHPFIVDRIKNLVRSYDKKDLVVIDAPLLFESGIDEICSFVISVIAPKETRVKRIISRDKIPLHMAVKRMDVQNNDRFYTEKSDAIIDGSLPKEKITHLLLDIVERYNESII